MSVESMMKAAHYGIAKMKEGEEFEFYFRATLDSLKGVRDHLLEEYNKKFGLGIGEEDNLYVSSFRAAAKSKGDSTAEKFIDLFDKEWASLIADAKVGLLLETHGIRDLEIHRGEQPRNFKLNLYENASA